MYVYTTEIPKPVNYAVELMEMLASNGETRPHGGKRHLVGVLFRNRVEYISFEIGLETDAQLTDFLNDLEACGPELLPAKRGYSFWHFDGDTIQLRKLKTFTADILEVISKHVDGSGGQLVTIARFGDVQAAVERVPFLPRVDLVFEANY